MELRPYQKEAARFLVSRKQALLADEMGLGKTPVTCVALRALGAKAALVVCPSNPLIRNMWAQRLVEWDAATEDQIHVCNSTTDDLRMHNKFIVVGYEQLLTGTVLPQLLQKKFAAVIIDEAQHLRNFKSKRSKKILGGKEPLIGRGIYQWLLSGCIMPNRPIELFPMLKGLAHHYIHPYTSLERFSNQFCGGLDGRGASNIDDLRKRLSQFMVRRQMKDVLAELPPVIMNDVEVDVGDLGCDESNTPLASLARKVGEAKAPYVVQYVSELLRMKQKILVFAYHRAVCEHIAEKGDYTASLVYGGMSANQKALAVSRFIKGDAQVLVAQISSAGEGVDGLQNVCDTLVFGELDWSAGTTDQAIGRLKRFGQQNPVNVFSFVAVNTLDEAMLGTYYKKKRIINQLLNGRKLMLEQEVKRSNELLEQILEVLKAGAAPKAATGAEKLSSDAASTSDTGAASTPAEPAKKDTKAKKDKAEKEEKAPPAPKFPTEEELRGAAKEALARLGGDEAARTQVKKVISSLGFAQLADITKEKYAAAIEGFQALQSAPSSDLDI